MQSSFSELTEVKKIRAKALKSHLLLWDSSHISMVFLRDRGGFKIVQATGAFVGGASGKILPCLPSVL